MNINSYNLSFNGYFKETKVSNPTIKADKLVHATYFFRDHKILEFINDYTSRYFPKGTNIANFGCSNGEECYSLAMLLADRNQDLKYKITGYDLSDRALEDARSGAFEISEMDNALLDIDEKKYSFINTSKYDPAVEKYRDVFYKNFDVSIQKSGDSWQYYKNCYLKPGPVKDSVDFKTGNIADIGTERLKLSPNTGVVIFKNAWYHLAPKVIDSTIQNIYNTLPSKGILVVGTLDKDHTLDNRKSYRELVLVKKLIDAGFEPVFKTANQFNSSEFQKFGEIPCIFRKP